MNTIVRQARRLGILCQGRGSAANSAVCYVLGVTAIDPVESSLLFERFVSAERHEPPDIDVDFEHERREEIIQWIYQHYGRDRAALCATIVRYRSRGAVREVGKVMGLTEDVTAALASQVWGWSEDGVEEHHAEQLNLNLADRRLRLTLEIARELIGHPRHMSQHPGGFVLTQDRLADLVPVEPASMKDRQVIEWDKDDIDILKFMKVDILGLGMLGCMRRAFDLLEQHRGIRHDMATIPQGDAPTYAMIQAADTLGTFQIESRAQMSMLPRHKPACLYDLTIQVAVVRPGPIQGDMVHPYLRRRAGLEQPEYPHPELERVLGKTLGVPLFQEQAMQVAIVCAGFTPGEADQLRRAMATFKKTGGVSPFRDKMINGMVARGYQAEFAERTFKQIEGFGSYGFPESHAASFALIAYASSWMKCHHPDVFCAALLNAQPMGFYAPAQVARDARQHGVEVRPPCVNASQWDCTLEPGAGRFLAVRMGLRMAKGLAQAQAEAVLGAAATGYASVAEVWRRAAVPVAALERLAEADAFAGLGVDRRAALWAIRGLGEPPPPLLAVLARPPRTRPLRAGEGGGAHRTARHPHPHDGRAGGGGGLPVHRADPAAAPRQLPAPRAAGARHGHLRVARRHAGGAAGRGARHRAGAAEARQRQGRHVHHDRGRDRHRQPGAVAQPVREAAPAGAVRRHARLPRPGAARRRGGPRRGGAPGGPVAGAALRRRPRAARSSAAAATAPPTPAAPTRASRSLRRTGAPATSTRPTARFTNGHIKVPTRDFR